MKHLNQEVAIAKLFTPSARQGLGHGYRDDSSASCEAPKNPCRFFPCVPQKIMILFYYLVQHAPVHDFLFNSKTAFRH
ncbi:MAG: hypothetical protein F6K24_03215 [Okeania sp. SIO2D1]|nr:hypothetical protein [Okeania sp. SIO2D1]